MGRTVDSPRYRLVSSRICDEDYYKLRDRAAKESKSICKLLSEIIKEKQ